MKTQSCIQLVSLALDASLMRQTAITNNMANINSKDYKAIEVNFEQQLEQGDLNTIHPFYQLSETKNSIDEQLVLNLRNIIHYRALIKGLNQKLSIMKLALQGNNA